MWPDRVSAATIARLHAAGVGPDLVVLDPPRAGAGADVIRAILAHRAARGRLRLVRPGDAGPRRRAARDAGWRLRRLRAFDAFPMTHHVECVAVLDSAHRTWTDVGSAA